MRSAPRRKAADPLKGWAAFWRFFDANTGANGSAEDALIGGQRKPDELLAGLRQCALVDTSRLPGSSLVLHIARKHGGRSGKVAEAHWNLVRCERFDLPTIPLYYDP